MRVRLKLSPAGIRLATLAILSIGCTDATRTTDLPAAPPAPPAAPPASPLIPRPGVTYDRVSPSSFTDESRYALYDDSTFSLRSVPGRWEYPGKFSRADSVITFRFDAWSMAGPWLARGVVRGDSLIVEYNDVMIMTDFEDGTYVRSSGQ